MLHDVHLAQGYEGSMLRTNGFYEQKRSYNLQKFKDFSDTEATIIGYEAGKGKRLQARLASFLCKMTKETSLVAHQAKVIPTRIWHLCLKIYTTILASVLRSPIFNEHKQVLTDTRYLKHLEIMNERIKDLIYEFEEGHINVYDFVHKLKIEIINE